MSHKENARKLTVLLNEQPWGTPAEQIFEILKRLTYETYLSAGDWPEPTYSSTMESAASIESSTMAAAKIVGGLW